MPSPLHELILMLFSTPLALLIQSLGQWWRVQMPYYREARTDSADLTDIQPAEYRADLVVTLVGDDASPVMGVIVEVHACEGLEADKAKRYADAVYASLSDAARQEVKKMGMKKWEYMSDFARGYVAEGRADVIRKLLSVRFGAIDPEVEARIKAASADELGDIGVRILTATTLEQVFEGR
jgi:hypothetical protein